MLDKLMPYARIKQPNPIFDFDQRHLSWPRKPADVRRYSINLLSATLVLSVVVCGLVIGSHSIYYSSIGLYNPIFVIIAIMTGAALFLSDISMVVATVNGLNRQITSIDWEMVKLSLQLPETIFAAKLTTAQLRAWRIMILEVAVRIVGAIPIFFLIIAPFLSSGSLTVYPNFYLGAYLDVFLNLIIVLLIFIAEPVVRMKVNVALAIAATARIHNSSFAILGAVGLIAAMHLLQGIFALATLILLGAFAFFINGSGWSFRAGILVLCGLLALLYRVIQIVAERYALRKLFQPEGA